MGRLGQVAQALVGAGSEAASAWLGEQVHALRHGREAAALVTLHDLAARDDLGTEVVAVVTETLGYPLGSGCVGSADKLLVEARLKGAGMHWSRANVNPLLTLRRLERNGRWETEWPVLWRAWC